MPAVRLELADANPSRILFESALVQVGAFRCPIGHPRFADSGPTRRYCFVFPRTSVWIQHDGGRPFVADSTIVPLYNAGHPYRRREISGDGDRTDWYGIAPALLREMLAARQSPAADRDRSLFDSDYARVESETYLRQRRLFHCVEARTVSDALAVEETVIALLGDVLGGETPATALRKSAAHRDLAEATRAHLATTFTTRTDLSALAATLGTSAFHLCRVFKSQSGQTIHRCRTELRLRHSLDRLAERDADILAIALDLGFCGHSHFTSAFHRAFGVTPSAYRKTVRRAPRRARQFEQARRARS